MNERSLACFSAAVRTGSFSLAAAELNVTQQSISYSMAKLEEELGFSLFVRGGQKPELTYWGHRFLAWYNALESELWTAFTKSAGHVYKGLLSDVQIRCFLALAENKHLDLAADALHYAPETVADYMEQLGKALGTEVAIRRGGSYILTDTGKLYEIVFRTAAENLRTLKEQQRQRQERGKKTAIVGVSPWLNPEKLFSKAIEQMGEDVLEIHTLAHEKLLDGLLSGRLDVVFWSEGQAPSGSMLVHTPIARERIGLIRPEGKQNCPVAFCPAWPRSVSEDRVIFVQELPLLHFRPEGMRAAEDFASLRELLHSGNYAAVTDIRFGSLPAFAGMEFCPLEEDSSVLASRLPGETGDCAERLIKSMQVLFCEDTKE